MRGWEPARQRVAAGALLAATLTAAAWAALGGSAWHLYGAVAYVIVAALAVAAPAWITAQVIAGQLGAASLLLGADATGALPVLLLVAAVAGTAELLAVVARMASARDRDGGRDVRRALVAAATAGALFGAVAFLGQASGPAGLLGVGLASGACVALAVLLARGMPGRMG